MLAAALGDLGTPPGPVHVNLGLREPLVPEHVKPRLLGHWGTTPGLNFIYVHLNRLIREAYNLLGLQTYFTVGPKETRAWTIHKGDKAPAAAGVIHSDFEKGFIRAEVIKLLDYQKYKTEQGCKEAGKMAVEGKEYTVEDGDIMHFRFNV